MYAVNTVQGTALSANGIYPLTNVIRRFGCDIASDGSGIVLKNSGYYDATGSVSMVATAEGVISASLYANGVAVPGATSSVTAAAGATVTLPINSIVRVNCCGNPVTLTLVVSGAGTSVNAEMGVVKL